VRIRVRNLDFDTTPCVLHHNGGDSICRYGLEFKRRFFELIGTPGQRFDYAKNGRIAGVQSYRRPFAAADRHPIPELSIVTFTSFRFPGSAQLSLEHLGVAIDVVHPREPYSNLRRIFWLREYLERIETEYVLVLDSHDTFVTSDLFGIVDAFRKQGSRLIFQGEAFEWPRAGEISDFYDDIAPGDSPFRYLCAGIMMGEREFLKRVLERACRLDPLHPNDDQGVYKQVFREFHPECSIDTHCRLFQSLTDYKHPDHPERFEPVDLNLEISFCPDPDAAADPKALAPGKVLRGASYVARRRLERAVERFAR